MSLPYYTHQKDCSTFHGRKEKTYRNDYEKPSYRSNNTTPKKLLKLCAETEYDIPIKEHAPQTSKRKFYESGN